MSVISEPSRLSYDAIREYAERIGEHYRAYDRAGACDVRALVERLGGRVAYGDSKESLQVYGPDSFTIYLPHMTSSRRDQFTIAHELGHFFLHYLHPELDGPARFGRGERNLLETQANVFASSLLMPADKFRRAWIRSGSDPVRVARQFEVSPSAAEVRAKHLGLL